jgi:hypothetical protein
VSRWPDDMTLAQARVELDRLARGDGEKCPVCTQNVKVYRRRLTAVAAKALIALYTDHGLDFGHLPSVARRHLPEVAHQGGYLVLSAHWSLMAEERGLRPDAGRAGYWHITGHGEQWLQGATRVPSHASIYNGRCRGLDGDLISVEDALGERFDFRSLMRDRSGAAGQAPLFEVAPRRRAAA